MLYRRFVIGYETLSSTSIFNFCHWAIFGVAMKAFILGPFNGNYRLGHVDTTSLWTCTASGIAVDAVLRFPVLASDALIEMATLTRAFAAKLGGDYSHRPP